MISHDAKVVAFISSKGGSGKTVTAGGLAHLIAASGKRVLLVDTDASTNGLTLLFLNEVLKHKKTSGVSNDELVGIFDISAGQKLYECPLSESIDLMPATYRLKQTEDFDFDTFQYNLRRTVNFGRSNYDVVLLDAQAGSDKYAEAAAKIADQVVIVSEYDPISSQGIDRLKVIFQNALAPERTWILFNKVLPEFTKLLGEGLEIARYLPPIPWTAEVVKAFARRKLAIDTARGNLYTLILARIAKRLFPDDIIEAIEAWEHSIAAAIKNPNKAILTAIERQIQELERERISAELKLQRKRFIMTATTIVFLMGAFVSGILLLRERFIQASSPFQIVSDLLFSPGLLSTIATATGAIAVIAFAQRWLADSAELELRSKIKETELLLHDALEERQQAKFLSEADIEAAIEKQATIKSKT